MSRSEDDAAVVLSGVGIPDPLPWRVRHVPQPQGNHLTYIEVENEGRFRTVGGFGGPALPYGSPINYWTGSADGLPNCLIVRCDPGVQVVIAGDSRNVEHQLPLCAVSRVSGPRFTALALTDGREIAFVHYSMSGQPLQDVEVRKIASSGWFAQG